MFAWIYKMYLKPKSNDEIRKEVNQHMQRTRRKSPLPRGTANLQKLKLNMQKINIPTFNNMLKKDSLNPNSNPTYTIQENSVTFRIPFSNSNTVKDVKRKLNIITSAKKNKTLTGQFKDVDMNIRLSNSNRNTLAITLKGGHNVGLPDYFVKKLFGAESPLLTRNSIDPENLIRWLKYQKYGKQVKHVKDLIRADKQVNENSNLYSLWKQHGMIVAQEVTKMKSMLDHEQFKKALGDKPSKEDILELMLREAMKHYLTEEKLVYNSKQKVRIKLDYQSEKIVWQYEMKPKKNPKNKQNSGYSDPWIRELSTRRGFQDSLNTANEAVKKVFTNLVNHYKSSIQPSNDIQEKSCKLYTACKRCKLDEHPLFRVLNGFDVINTNSSTDFMNYFRFAIHNDQCPKSGQQIPVSNQVNLSIQTNSSNENIVIAWPSARNR